MNIQLDQTPSMTNLLNYVLQGLHNQGMKYNILVLFVLSLGACFCAKQTAFDKHFQSKDEEIFKIFNKKLLFCSPHYSKHEKFFQPLKTDVFVKEKLFKFTGSGSTEVSDYSLKVTFDLLFYYISIYDYDETIKNLEEFYNEYEKADSKLYDKKISLDNLTIQIFQVLDAYLSEQSNFNYPKEKEDAALANKVCKERLPLLLSNFKNDNNNPPPISPTGTGRLPPLAIGAIIASIVILVIVVIVVIYLKMKK